MSKKEKILNKLFSLQRFGIKPGLERTLKLSEYIGSPHLKFPSVHVAGTNGKGSVCAMLASILMEAGYEVGLNTSPHLLNFNERIRINHTDISGDEMVELAEKLLIGEEKWGCTFFEITTVMAFEHFAKNNVDIAIIETGMGGRFDSTNILSPLLSIITSIDLDHKEYLGNTLEEIAFEKAGIIKENTPVVIAKYPISVKNVFLDKANELKSKLFDSSELCLFENHIYNPDFSQTFDLKFKETSIKNITIGLAGEHQLGNVAEVLTAIDFLTVDRRQLTVDSKEVKTQNQKLKLKNRYLINEHDIRNGMLKLISNTGLRGRIEPFFQEGRRLKSEVRSQKSEVRITENREPRTENRILGTGGWGLGAGREDCKLATPKSQIPTYNDILRHAQDDVFILDTGHNPGAISKLVETLKLHRPNMEKWNFVYGGMADKDIKSNLNIIEPFCDELILTRPQIDRALEVQKLKEIAEELQFRKIVIKPNVSEAVKYAIQSRKPTIISGSFYLAGEALPLLEKMLKFQS